jgi:hypothetical protein
VIKITPGVSLQETRDLGARK